MARIQKKLSNKVKESERIIKDALGKYKNIGIAWTGGKDSTLVLSFVRQLFPEQTYKIIFLDSGVEFPELYDFIREVQKKWDLKIDIFNYQAPTALKARENKIKALNQAIKKLKLDCLLVGIRWDEHPARSKEKYFSPRKTHVRVHPILHWLEGNIWEYTRKNLPYCKLYDQGYKSLGEAPFTKKTKGKERSGRDQDKEIIMSRLRDLGYF